MNQRMNRVNELLQQEISKLLQEEFAEDYGLISVTYVSCAPDLKQAKIGISTLDKSKEDEIINALQKKSGKLRYDIGNSVNLKNIPKLDFLLDQGTEKVIKVDKLLDKIGKEDKR